MVLYHQSSGSPLPLITDVDLEDFWPVGDNKSMAVGLDGRDSVLNSLLRATIPGSRLWPLLLCSISLPNGLLGLLSFKTVSFCTLLLTPRWTSWWNKARITNRATSGLFQYEKWLLMALNHWFSVIPDCRMQDFRLNHNNSAKQLIRQMHIISMKSWTLQW